MVLDYFIRGYDAKELLKEGGKYWYRSGVNVTAVAIWAASSAFCLLLNMTSVLGIEIPVIADIASNYGSSLPTLALTAVLYLPAALASRRR